MKALLFALFLANSALAQPVVGPEVFSTPIEALGDIALAARPGGFVIAWEAAGHFYVGDLDSTLQLEGSVVELQATQGGRAVSGLSLATNGRTALVAWHEHYSFQDQTNAAAILLTDPVSVLQSPQVLSRGVTPPVATWDGGSYVVYSAGYQLRLTDALDAFVVRGWRDGTTAALSNDGNVAIASHDGEPQLRCVCFNVLTGVCNSSDCRFPVTYRFTLRSGNIWTPYVVTVKYNSTVSLLPPIVAANGASFTSLARLPSTTDVHVFDDAAEKRTTLPVVILTDAAIGGNGSDVLVVWTGSLLRGLLVHADGSVSEPFEISGGAIDEPHVVAAGSNTFVVFYRVDLGSNQKALAGRLIQLQPSKHRAIR
jgi:hypothetical protein